MKKICSALVLTLSLTVITGCEWTTGGGAETWNEAYNFVNFSGIYRGVEDNPIVSDYTGVTGSQVTVAGESLGSGNGSSTTFAGTLDHRAVVKGSLTITVGGFRFTDPDGNGALTGAPSGSGSISYDTGSWYIDLAGTAPGAGSSIQASYIYSAPGATAGPGSSGGTILSFTVWQEGNTITITDNLGAQYRGNFGDLRSTGGTDQNTQVEADSVVAPPSNIIGSFSAEGVNAAGLKVNIVGVLTGVVVGGGSSVTGRTMEGTYAEDGGQTGNINGKAQNV